MATTCPVPHVYSVLLCVYLPLGLSEMDCRVVVVARLSVSSSICSGQPCLGHLGFAGRIAKPVGTPVACDCGPFAVCPWVLEPGFKALYVGLRVS